MNTTIIEIIDEIEENYDARSYYAKRARKARAELAALLARIAQLEADVATMEVTEYEAERFAPEYKRQIEEPLETRITELVTAVREAQVQLRATSRNWDEDCLYRADDILTNALAAHPVPEPVTL
jgi:hypothetical protein